MISIIDKNDKGCFQSARNSAPRLVDLNLVYVIKSDSETHLGVLERLVDSLAVDHVEIDKSMSSHGITLTYIYEYTGNGYPV